VGREGGMFGAKNQTASCGGLVLTNDIWEGLYLDRGDLVGVG